MTSPSFKTEVLYLGRNVMMILDEQHILIEVAQTPAGAWFRQFRDQQPDSQAAACASCGTPIWDPLPHRHLRERGLAAGR